MMTGDSSQQNQAEVAPDPDDDDLDDLDGELTFVHILNSMLILEDYTLTSTNFIFIKQTYLINSPVIIT